MWGMNQSFIEQTVSGIQIKPMNEAQISKWIVEKKCTLTIDGCVSISRLLVVIKNIIESNVHWTLFSCADRNTK